MSMDNDSQNIEMISGASVAPLNTPVLFLIFCRPETTKQVFEAIRKAKPTRLYVAADGPRDHRPGEAEKCEATRKIATAVDWNCEVRTLFRDENMGLGKGLSAAITWFFEHETEGIILEDDCLPSPSFFTFCAAMLERYRDDTRIMEIGGNNFEKPHVREREYSYYFSNLAYIWGWATWRRAWKLHDFRMNHYREINEKRYLNGHFSSIYERHFYQYVFEKIYRNDHKISPQNVWSYQWQFACRINSGLIIVPNCNLVINLGIGGEATNTTSRNGIGNNLKLEEIEFPLKHPEFVMMDKQRVKRDFRNKTSASTRIKSNIKRIVPRPLLENIIKPLMQVFSL
jgi:hypothetical protein